MLLGLSCHQQRGCDTGDPHHQHLLAHEILLSECRELLEVIGVLQEALDIRDRRAAGVIGLRGGSDL